MANRQVWVERAPLGRAIIRIFRGSHSPDWQKANECGLVSLVPKFDAVSEIRKQIWQRCAGNCEWCGKRIRESGSLYERGHMHEKIPKGNGGEVSLDNGIFLCYNCHINVAHGDRRPRFSLGNLEE